MKTLVTAAALVSALALPLASVSAPILTVDQENLVGGNEGSKNSSVGQSFVPTLEAMDAVEISLEVVSGPMDFIVNIRSGVSGAYGMSGPILGSSAPVTVSNLSQQMIHFDLASQVTLVPGNTYVVQVVPQTSGYYRWAEVGSNPYASGQHLQTGLAPGFSGIRNVDMTFRTGLHDAAVATDQHSWGEIKAVN